MTSPRAAPALALATDSNRGLVLVAAVGILGVLSVMGLAFASVMRLEARAARNFTHAVRAEFVARAGIEDAIARLRSMARDGAERPYTDGMPAAWYTWRGTAGGGTKPSFPATEATNGLDDDGDGLIDAADPDETSTELMSYTDAFAGQHVDGGETYTLRVEDAASKINVNAGDNLGTILDNLCRVIGPPLVAARQEALVPKWFASQHRQYADSYNASDNEQTRDLFYRVDALDRPLTDHAGKAIYGDGYAIAGRRSRVGAFVSAEEVREALTWVERNDPAHPKVDTPEERLEIEAKFAALRPYITIDSWSDTDQIGYGKFEHVVVDGKGSVVSLIDRNRTWNAGRNDGAGELAGCLVVIVNGVGQGQAKTIAGNTIDTIILDDSLNPHSQMLVPPTHDSSYIIIGKDHRGDANWQDQVRLYARQPLSIHRAPVNVNTATDKVLVSLLLGLQTNWGAAGYHTNERARAVAADAWSLCPSVLAVGRDMQNAHLAFELPCPNDSSLSARFRDPVLARHGHADGAPPYCFFCNYGALPGAERPGFVGEAHYLAWQILKEREQTRDQDVRSDHARAKYSNGWGPFKGWDDVYFRAFRPWERSVERELSVEPQTLTFGSVSGAPGLTSTVGVATGHPGIARLCMANFSSNTDVLKFQPNIEWINRWGPNFTDLYVPHPELMSTGSGHLGEYYSTTVKLRVRPGELLDKTDLNVGTTEFAFDSGGVYEVTSTATIRDGDGVVAQKMYSALVRIYGVWRESTQREFLMGTIDDATGLPGTQTAGQVAVDRGGAGGGAAARKALCSYPEPLVPAGTGAPLSLGRGAAGVAPAGYDGQILLATNMSMTGADDAPPDATFYHSFTGSMRADVARGSAEPLSSALDEVGLLGAIDSAEFDVPPIRDKRNVICDGEGKGGDLRPDGVYLGVTDPLSPLDGSFEFSGKGGNIDWWRGTVSMWVKPAWHQGTVMRPSLPLSYLTGNDAHSEKGSTVAIPHYSHWERRQAGLASHPPTARGVSGYVRERFEHEFFNGTMDCLDVTGYGSQAFMLRKAGDRFNTINDVDMMEGGYTATAPLGALHLYMEDGATHEICTWVPGWLLPSTSPYYRRQGAFYRMCPFRWTYLGLTWNYHDFANRNGMYVTGHHVLGQLREAGKETGGDRTIADGSTFPELPRDLSGPKGDMCTNYNLLTEVMAARPFVDTMATWDADAGGEEEGLESWAHEQYGVTCVKWPLVPPAQAAAQGNFGINRRPPRESGTYFQRACSGTYAVIDEFAISREHHSPFGGSTWPARHRRATGRYYFERDARKRPKFVSQSLLASEMSQNRTFADDEADEVIELGTVRWTVFTPYYCIEQRGISDYEFPFDSYFLESESSGNQNRRVSQSWRPGRAQWTAGPRSRNSSQRGCTVSIVTGPSSAPAEANYEYVDPEGWEAILAGGTASGRHARSTPGTLTYAVRFGFSAEEMRRATTDAVLLDTPVFDDITITYLRRPKILAWRDWRE